MSAEVPANVHVLCSRAVRHLMTVIRDKSTPCDTFVHYSDRLFRSARRAPRAAPGVALRNARSLHRLLAEEAITFLPSRDVEVQTPVPGAVYHGVTCAEDKLCAVSIVRAGDALLRTVREVLPGTPVGKILIQRDESTPEKLPKARGPPQPPLPPPLTSARTAPSALLLQVPAGHCGALRHPDRPHACHRRQREPGHPGAPPRASRPPPSHLAATAPSRCSRRPACLVSAFCS